MLLNLNLTLIAKNKEKRLSLRRLIKCDSSSFKNLTKIVKRSKNCPSVVQQRKQLQKLSITFWQPVVYLHEYKTYLGHKNAKISNQMKVSCWFFRFVYNNSKNTVNQGLTFLNWKKLVKKITNYLTVFKSNFANHAEMKQLIIVVCSLTRFCKQSILHKFPRKYSSDTKFHETTKSYKNNFSSVLNNRFKFSIFWQVNKNGS